jgi:phosphoribosylglycinamide formyltransferase 1
MLRLVALISGGGTNLGHLLDAIDAGKLQARMVGVLASRPDAPGLERARMRGVPARAVSRRTLGEGAPFQDEMHRQLAELAPDLLVFCGFLSRLELRSYTGRAMNIHPALIPAFSGHGFYGARVHRAVLESGVKLTGVTVHFCDDHYDTGPIILQQAVEVLDDDTPETLAARVQEVEREIYPRAVQLYAEGRLEIRGRRVHVVRGPAAGRPDAAR